MGGFVDVARKQYDDMGFDTLPVIGGGKYSLISGDFSIRPTLEVKDILPILGNREIVTERKPTLSRKAVALLHGKDELINTYSNRSEAEQSLIASLVNTGFSFWDVLVLFNRHPCAGKYAELKAEDPKNAEHWLRHSYQEAAEWARTHESKARQIAGAAIAWWSCGPRAIRRRACPTL